jgi:hypothetical protein
MARRSILSAVRYERPTPEPIETAPVTTAPETTATRPSRIAKLHIGGYFEPGDPTVMAFQKLKVDLRRSQQDMLLEALRDFVAKHEAESAFRQR